MLPEEFDNSDENNSAEVNPDTARYLQHVERKLYDDIKSRKLIDNSLLFLACQIGSSSLAWLLFSLQISTSLIMAVSISCALLPGLIDAGETFYLDTSGERWNFFHKNPTIAISKLIIGGVINWHSTNQILRDAWATEDAIKATYVEIKNAENKTTDAFQISINRQDALSVVGLLVVIALIILVNKIIKNVPR